MSARVTREQTYWDEAYRPAGSEHSRYLWTKHVEGLSYIGERFHGLVRPLSGKRVLSLGGGVDRLGVALAKAGNQVVTVDVSPVAAAATTELAEREGTAAQVTALVGSAEEAALTREAFDVVLCKRALHHMDIPRIIARVHDLLAPDGLFLVEEPVCLFGLLRWVHRKLPFHPEAPRTEDERELTEEDLALVRNTFRQTEVWYFDLLARESIAYFLYKLRLDRLLNPLGKFDYFLINRCLPLLRCLCTYAIIRAVK